MGNLSEGWVWGASGLESFAQETSTAYLDRSIIIWNDSVKLRYGDKPEDNPWLWSYMLDYVLWNAKNFDG